MKLQKLIQTCVFAVVCSITLPSWAQETLLGLPPLHVDGKYFKDEQGNKVVLHGVMDTPSTYFNNNRWHGKHTGQWTGSDGHINYVYDDYNPDGTNYDTKGTNNCRRYFEQLFVAVTDKEKGAYCNLFRLHLDPAWTNNSNLTGKVDDRERYYQDNGQTKEISGEADFRHYSGTRLTNYLKTLYFPIAKSALKHGMYVIMRPPGVCPPNIYVGGTYQKFLLNVWKRVSENDSIRKYSGQISLELANEPINVYNADGTSGPQALHDFFQPIVDQIRENGFKGIILVPGTGYQSNYRDYATYPITGDNIGYAVHNYAGWYDNRDDHCDINNAITKFGEAVPVVLTHPIVITEVDWSPKSSSRIKNYNEMGQPVYDNYGTWATASTSKWGKAYKAILDYYGNISMTLTGISDYIDIDDCINIKNKTTSPTDPSQWVYEQTGRVTPAFKTAMEKDNKDPYEGCGVACFQWYADYAKVNYASEERYQPLQEVPENPFEFSKNWFKPSLIKQGSATHLSAYSLLIVEQNGMAGWSYEDRVDLSDYQTLVVTMHRAPAKNTYLRIYDGGSLWGDYYQLDLGGKTEIEIPLHEVKKASGELLDPSHIRYVGFTPQDAKVNLFIKEVSLKKESTAINAIEADGTGEEGYLDLMGRPVSNPTRGIFIRRSDKKKVYIK